MPKTVNLADEIAAFVGARGWLALAVAVLAAAMNLLAACQGTTPQAGATPEAGHMETEALEGHTLFVEKGCASCHGRNGEGTAAVPALQGHTVEQVEKQVRDPRAVMPRFGPELISDAELHEIAHYVTSLGGAHGHE
jgi:ubiquinol-cytochrome c reductase cytochrome c subunit